jgi:retron-type reverse transcriptase
MLYASYWKIRSKPKNTFSSNDKITFDGIDGKYFLELHNNLRNESWRPKPSKRIYIKKANGKFRFLGIPSPRDKIVQESYKAVLSVVLEPKFLDVSTGFRENFGCHDALAQIRYWNGVKWFIEGDISNFFDEIDHHILEKLLIEHFNDQRFIDLYWKFVRAGFVEFNSLKINDIGVPQGSVVSPILSNLYLHELDKFIQMEKEQLLDSKLKISLRNLVYSKLNNRIQNITKREKSLLEKKKCLPLEVKMERLKLVKLRRRTNSTMPNPIAAKIYYVRYADD